jgi:hypothetical protein
MHIVLHIVLHIVHIILHFFLAFLHIQVEKQELQVEKHFQRKNASND